MALNLPTVIHAGDTLSFTDSVTDYPASDGWTLHYAMVNATEAITINSTADGDSHVFSVASGTTGLWAKGSYKWAAYVTNVGGDKFTVETGVVEIKPDYTAGAIDDRHHVEIVLDALEAALVSKASSDQLSLTIAGRSISRMPPSELYNWRDKYKNELKNIRRLEAIANGKSGSSNIYTRI